MFTLHYLKPSSDYLNTYQYLIYAIFDVHFLWNLAPKPHFSTCTQGMICKNNTQNKQKKPIWNYLCFFLLKVTYKMECGLGLWEIYGFCFLLELWLGALSHTAAFRDNISRKHYPTTNPIKLEEIYSFLIKLYRCFTDPIPRPWYSFIHSNGMVL